MKAVLLTLGIVFISIIAYSQETIDRYISILPGSSGIFGTETIINTGRTNPITYLTDHTLKENYGRIQSITNDVDLINYMNYLGWNLADPNFRTPGRLYFKKTLLKEEVKLKIE